MSHSHLYINLNTGNLTVNVAFWGQNTGEVCIKQLKMHTLQILKDLLPLQTSNITYS